MEYPVVLENAYLRVQEVEAQRTLILTRLAERADDTASLVATYQEALAASSHYRGWALLMDLRQAPSRNDEAFEKAVVPMRLRLDEVFVRTVSLVASAAGALQIRRLARDRGQDVYVTSDEQEALRLCREG